MPRTRVASAPSTLHLDRAALMRRLIVLSVVALSVGCAKAPIQRIGAVTPEPTGLTTVGKFVWVDLVTQDTDRAEAFYGSLFGWTFSRLGPSERYIEIRQGSSVIGGMVAARDEERGSEWIPNLSVADVDSAAKLVQSRGGVIEQAAVDAPDRGRLALVSDAEGALLLLLRANGGDPRDAPPAEGRFLWQELWSHDVEAAASLYSTLGGYQSETVDFREVPYRVLKTGETPRAGIVPAPPEVKPLWLPYVRVGDATETAARAAELGARVVMQGEGAAILVDPTGAPVGVQEWSERQ